jgi:glucose/arabinose dehydrogenase
MLYIVVMVALATLALFSSPPVVQATTLPAQFVESQVVGGLQSPTAMQFAPDGRLFVAEQVGRLRVIQNGQLLSTPFINLSVNSVGERGLLGIAFDPNFATNNYIYLYYTTSNSPIRNRVSRFTANGNVVVSGSEVILMNLDPLSGATNHNGGAMHFGSDGMLYVATGENANTTLSQDMTSPYGKMLRINPALYNASNVNALFPSDNPFWQTPTSTTVPLWRNAIWALGFRNPFTFDVQRGTGRIFINDVGSSGDNQREEINDGARGANYGWPNTEGDGGTNPNFTLPLYAYGDTGAIRGCAITGGAFYNPQSPSFPAEYVGDFFFADYCNNWIARYDIATDTATMFATGIAGSTVDLKVNSAGVLFYLSRGAGGVFLISYNAPPPTNTPPPPPTNTPRPNTRPTATITAPANGARYSGGDIISFSGTGTDAEDGTLPASRFEWEVVFHHDAHTHPFLQPFTGVTSGTFEIPREGHTETTVWFRIYLRVTDSAGLRHETFVDIFPNVVSITVQTNPTGLQVTVDGQPRTAPYAFDAVVGNLQSIGATSPQTINGIRYTFANWSHGGAQTQQITIPSSNTTYTANFNRRLIGDINNDGRVTLVDFSLLASSYNRSSGQQGFNPEADLNGDGAVSLVDFSLLASNFNRSLP